MAACAPPGEQSGSPTLRLVPQASVSVPLSNQNDIALIEEDVACVVNSFEFEVSCFHRRGQIAGIFGRKGEGPGEFLAIGELERAPDGTVGVIDNRLGRVTVFDVSGKLLSENALPSGFLVSQLIGERVFGMAMDFSSIDPATASRPPSGDRREAVEAVAHLFIPGVVDILSSRIVWSRNGIADDADCLVTAEGAMAPDGSLVFWTCTDDMVVFGDKDGPGEVRRSPAYVEEFPGERDVQEFLDGMSGLAGGTSAAVHPSVSDPFVALYRNQPKRWYLGGGQTFRFDDQGRTWAATSRDRSEQSYIEVWEGLEYVGTVAIQDRLVGYDLLGDILVALVERAPGPEGIAPRAVDWYPVPSDPSAN